jgi:tetratricopeptide (TPR) repeat protein
MPVLCTLERSVRLTVAVAASAVLALPLAVGADGQSPDVQRLFQAGSYDEAVDKASGGDPATLYVAALARLRQDRVADAHALFGQVKSRGQDWSLIGDSGEALAGGDGARALDLARRATESNRDNPWAYYQLGLAASKQNDFSSAAAAFTRSIELNNDFAYAHYYAALAHQRLRQLAKSAERFDAFLHLAPDAPEKQAVQAILRTLK